MRTQSLSRKISLAYSILVIWAAGLLTPGLYWRLCTVQQQIRDRLQELLTLGTPPIDSDDHNCSVNRKNSSTIALYLLSEQNFIQGQTVFPTIALKS